MTLRNIIVAVVLICSFTNAKAQNYELGKVTIAELEEKSNPKDTTAPAAILFKKEELFLHTIKKMVFRRIMYMNLKLKFTKKKGLVGLIKKCDFI